MHTCKSVANLQGINEEEDRKLTDTGNLFFVFSSTEGKGYVAYKINSDQITITAIKTFPTKKRTSLNIIEDLIGAVVNNASALNKRLVIDPLDSTSEDYIRRLNDRMKEQKIEELYRWTIQ